MRKIVVLTFVSLDGVMQAPGGPDAPGAREQNPDPAAAAERSRRRAMAQDLPGGAREREAIVRRRHETSRLPTGLEHDDPEWGRDRFLRASGRCADRLVRLAP